MIKKKLKLEMLLRVALVFLCPVVFCTASESTAYAQSSTQADIHEYKSFALNPDIRRREAGLSEEEKQALGGTGSTVRGTARGTARGAARGTARGAARGTARGAARGTARGVTRGTARGTARGEVRGTARGEVRGTARGEVRGAARGEVRGTARGEVRGAARGEVQRSRIESIYAELEDDLQLFPNRIEPLAPQRIGYSYDAQPELYFYMNKPSSKPIEFTLNRVNDLEPVIIGYIPVDPESKVIDPGIHSVSLKEFDVVLEEGVEYEWFVAIVVDTVERSGDIVASGIITHRENPMVNVQLPEQDLYGVYAANGYWYDAINTVLSLRQEYPQTTVLNQQLVHWLSQEKLPSTVAFLSKD